jgi:hypothetical protein
MPSIRSVADVQHTSADGTALHQVGTRHYPVASRELTPEAFDAPVNGDASAALLAMFEEIKDGDVVRFSRLHDCSAELYTSANNVTFVSSTNYSMAGIRGLVSGMQICTLGGFGALWDGPMLVGDGTIGAEGVGSTIKGLEFLRSDDSGNIDSQIISGTFNRLAECVKASGRNLHVRGSLFTTSIKGIVIESLPDDECRAISIEANRFHSMGGIGLAAKCIEMPSSSFDCVVSNNRADSIHNFYTGPLLNTVVDNNKIFKCAGEGISIIDPDPDVVASVQLGGSVSMNYVYKNSPSYLMTSGISLRKLRDGRVIGNIVVGPRAHGIAMYDCTSNVVHANSIVAPGYSMDAAVYGIYGDEQTRGNIYMGNSIRSAGRVGTAGGISVHSENKVEINTVDPLYTSNMYNRNTPTLALV